MKKFFYEGKTEKGLSFPYLLYIPQDRKKDERLPLIVSLHGAGERGDDLDVLLKQGAPRLFCQGKAPRCALLAPLLCENDVWIARVHELKKLIDAVVKVNKFDEDRISVTGYSMGGFGTWQLAALYPQAFSAIAPMCGGGMSWQVIVLEKMSVWAFHGDKDAIVPIGNSYDMVDALSRVNANVRFTILHGITHNCWDFAYDETRVLQWLVEQNR